MGVYRRRPVDVIAHRIGDDDWPPEIWDGVNRGQIVLHLRRTGAGLAGTVDIWTHDGLMVAEVGDYIVHGGRHGYFPLKSDVFQRVYEPVTA